MFFGATVTRLRSPKKFCSKVVAKLFVYSVDLIRNNLFLVCFDGPVDKVKHERILVPPMGADYSHLRGKTCMVLACKERRNK